MTNITQKSLDWLIAESVNEPQEVRLVKIPLSYQEKQELREALVNTDLNIRDTQLQKAEAIRMYNQKLKDLQKGQTNILNQLHTDLVEVEAVVFDVPNFETQKLETYTSEGIFINSRPLTSKEIKQYGE